MIDNKRKSSRSYQPGQRRYPCDVENCNTTFSRLEHLRRHKAILHEKTIDFKCTYCNRGFSRKDILKRHLQRRHNGDNKSDDEEEEEEGDIKAISSPNPVSLQMFNATPLFDYSSPSFSDNTSNSPEAILGNSNQAVSHLLNEDFMTWLLSRGIHPGDGGGAGSGHGHGNGNGNGNGSSHGHGNGNGDVIDHVVQSNTNAHGIDSLSSIADNASISESSNITGNRNGNNNVSNGHTNIPSVPLTNASPNSFSFQNFPLDTNYYDIDLTIMEGNHFIPSPPQPLPQTYPCSDATSQAIRNIINISQSDPLVQKFIRPSFISHAIDVYWSVHSRWPILHKPSFNINLAPPHLLIAMITISMYIIRDEEARELAIKLHETFRYSIYISPEFKAPTAIWVFQSLLLAEIFEMMTSTEEQHDMASRFYQVLIASMRQGGTMGGDKHDEDHHGSGNGSGNNSGNASDNEDLSETDIAWKSFIKHEAKKRIAFFAFVLDTQHCAFFNKPPSVFISDLPFRLPCEEAVWEVEDSQSWLKLKNSYPPTPYFQQMISTFLKLESFNIPHQLSPWNMMIIFHGLVSVGWRTRLRESIIITGEEESSSTNNFVSIVSESYYGWLRHYRTAFITSNKLPFNHPYVLGCLTTYEFAHVILNTDIQRCQDFLQFLVSSSTSSKSIKTCRVLCHWVTSINAISAVTHSLDLIDMFLVSEKLYDVSKETAFHRPWCLYLSAVTVWIFEYISRYDKVKSDNLSLSQYLGRVRATLSKQGHENRSALAKLAISPHIIYDKKNIGYCEANVLLQQIIQLLKPSRWGVLQNRIKVLEDLLR